MLAVVRRAALGWELASVERSRQGYDPSLKIGCGSRTGNSEANSPELLSLGYDLPVSDLVIHDTTLLTLVQEVVDNNNRSLLRMSF